MKNEIDEESKQILNELIEKIVNNLEKVEKTTLKRPTQDDQSNEFGDENDLLNDDETNGKFLFDSKCSSCNSNWSPIWRRVARTKYVCNKCFFNKTYLITINDENNQNKSNNEKLVLEKKTRSCVKNQLNNKQSIVIAQLSSLSSNSSESTQIDDSKTTRKSTRFTKTNNKSNKNSKKVESTENILETNQINRRTKLFKKTQPFKHETLESSIITSDYVFYKGFYYQIGDIVALFDLEDEETIYFAQIRAFLIDQFGDKSAVITWLIPSTSEYSSQIKTIQDFDPDMFELGPAEEYPRSLEYMEFVCRLTSLADKIKSDDLVRSNCKFKNELLRHKFSLEDIAASNVKLISKKTSDNSIEFKIKYQ